MSQERTRFPIQPQDRRRSAKSDDDVKTPPEETLQERRRGPDQDKPAVPPDKRRDRD